MTRAEIIITALVLFGMAAMPIFIDKMACSAKWQDSGFEHKWSVMGSCKIKTASGWISTDNYKEIN